MASFYAIQVKTGSEEYFTGVAREIIEENGGKLYWLRREMRIRRRGKWQKALSSIYPGYLFLHIDELGPELIRTIRQTKGFIKFLKDNRNIRPLSRRDSEIVSHFLKFGEIAKQSLVTFDENSMVRVISGPLRGLEGKIVRINRRKGRAKVRLQLYENVFTVDLSFEILSESKGESTYNKSRDTEN